MSGMPMMPPKMYSGDSAVPAIRSVRRLPLTSAETAAPGLQAVRLARTAPLTTTSPAAGRAPASGQPAAAQHAR